MARTPLTAEERAARKREYNRRWAQANRDKMRLYNAKYEAANKDAIAARKAAARQADPEKFRMRSARWRAENPDKAREQSARRYRERPEEFKSQIAAWRAANPERYAEVRAAQRRKPESVSNRREYARVRHSTDPQARLATLLRNRLRKALKGERKSAATIALLGCSLAEALSHIEARFLPGMTWRNHGEWHIDHVRPLASFDLSDSEQCAQACHYTNLRPLWGRDNQSKGARYEPDADARAAEHPMD